MPAELQPSGPTPHGEPPPPPAADHDPGFRLLFSGYAHPMWVYDSETLAFLDVNDAAIREYGYSRAQFMAMRITDIRPPEDVPALQDYLATGPTFLHLRTWRHRRADGSLFEVDATSQPLTFAGRPARMVMSRPVSENRHDGMRAQPVHVLESVEQGVIATDAGGQIRYWNAGAARLWGVPAEQALGRPITEVIVPLVAGGQAVTLFARQLQGERWSAQWWLPAPDSPASGEILVLVSANPFTGEGGAIEGTIIVAQDITDLHRSRETLQFLADVHAVLAASLDERALLDALTRLAVPFLADWAMVDMLREGQLTRAAASSRPGGAEILQAQIAVLRSAGPTADFPYARVLRERQALLFDVVDETGLDRFAISPEHLSLLRAMDARSVMVVPLPVDGGALGTLTLISSLPERRYTEQDLALAEEVARRAALALTQAQLYHAEQAARRAAEDAAARVGLLQELTAALAGALAEHDVTRLVVNAGVTSLGAIRTALMLPDATGTALRSSSAAGYPAGSEQMLFPLTLQAPAITVFQTGQPVFFSSQAERLERFPEGDATLGPLPGEARCAVPLLLGERTLGVLVLSYAEQHTFSTEERDFLLALGRQAAQALDRARLYDAERAARERIALLSDISAELASSLEYEETLQRVARLALPLAGDLCMIYLIAEDGTPRRVAVAAHRQEDQASIRRLLELGGPVAGSALTPGRVLASGKSEFIPWIDDARFAGSARTAEHHDALRALQLRSVICVPLEAQGRTFGAMFVARTRTGHYTEQDIPLVEEVARRAAQAVENARLYREAQETAVRERAHAARLRMLAAAALDISAARTLQEIAHRAVQQARAITGAGIGCAAITSATAPGGTLTAWSLAVQYAGWECSGYLPAAGLPAAALRAARPLRLSRAAAFEPGVPGGHPPISGWLSAPLTGHDREPLGLLYLTDPDGDVFTAEDEAVINQLALISGVAVESLWLARAAAEADAALAADALKTELLNTVSHELRTPLAAIKGYASNLLHFGEGVPPAERQEFLEEIDAAANRLAELVDNLLQVARQESGTLDFLREPVALGGVLGRAVADTRARHPGRQVELRLPERLPLVDADARRLLQALANLLDNAVKYSPAGGTVLIRAAAGRRQVRISVADAGIGIPAAYRARVFERFFRVPGPRSVEIGGTGLGLSITQHIVEQHGGSIRVKSRAGKGTIVTITLPRA